MSVIRIVQKVKEIHPEYLVLVKIGTFYHAYGKDAYILSYLFKYNLKQVEKTSTCGFPTSCAKRILANLEQNEINYLILDRRNNYDVDEKTDYKKKNQYKKYYSLSYPYVRLKARIDNLYQFMLDNIQEKDLKEKIISVEEILYEGREI